MKKKIVRKKPKKKTIIKKKSTVKLSAPNIQKLSELSNQLGEIFPASSYYSGSLSFEKIASDYKLAKYWPNKGNKETRMNDFLKKVYKDHKRTLIKIIRENLSLGIKRRFNQGNPVLKPEILRLDITLKELGINLTKEIKALKLPDQRPRIVPPPQQFKSIIKNFGLHPTIIEKCESLFCDGHINESARKSLEIYEKQIQDKTNSFLVGKELMGFAFNITTPKILIADLATENGKGIQEGVMHFSMGAMRFWRNYFSHGDEEEISHFDCVTILAMVSHLMFYIDKSTTN